MSQIKAGCLAWINQGEYYGVVVEVLSFKGEHARYGRMWQCKSRDNIRIPSIFTPGKVFDTNSFSCREIALTPINDPDQVIEDIKEHEHAE